MRYQGDPYWTQARFSSTCHKCGNRIQKGSDIFVYPRKPGRAQAIVYCGGVCGDAASADFNQAAEDEEFYNRGSYGEPDSSWEDFDRYDF